jgi:heme exporter protein CcmD
MDITHYFDMGKYDAYVWSSYALSALVLLGNLLLALRGYRKEHRRAWRRREHGRESES